MFLVWRAEPQTVPRCTPSNCQNHNLSLQEPLNLLGKQHLELFLYMNHLDKKFHNLSLHMEPLHLFDIKSFDLLSH